MAQSGREQLRHKQSVNCFARSHVVAEQIYDFDVSVLVKIGFCVI